MRGDCAPPPAGDWPPPPAPAQQLRSRSASSPPSSSVTHHTRLCSRSTARRNATLFATACLPALGPGCGMRSACSPPACACTYCTWPASRDPIAACRRTAYGHLKTWPHARVHTPQWLLLSGALPQPQLESSTKHKAREQVQAHALTHMCCRDTNARPWMQGARGGHTRRLSPRYATAGTHKHARKPRAPRRARERGALTLAALDRGAEQGLTIHGGCPRTRMRRGAWSGIGNCRKGCAPNTRTRESTCMDDADAAPSMECHVMM